jgi:hypothetical protein
MGLVLLVSWIIGALITLKVDAMLCYNPTEWCLTPIALMVWPIVAVLILHDKHEVRNSQGWSEFYKHVKHVEYRH